MTEWAAGRVIENRLWTEHLHSLRIEADIEPFKAGQYTRLALEVDDVRVARPYSFVNPPDEPVLEFFFNSVPGGPLSNRLINMVAGESIWVSRQGAGYLVLEEVPEGRDLWMLATGTAIGPFLSMLRTSEPWERFDNLRLAYAVRHEADLCYRETLDGIAEAHGEQFAWVPFVSREPMIGAMDGRIPAAITEGRLEDRFALALSAVDSQVMICGNPEMVKDSIAALKARGLSKNLRRTPGQISVERYW